MKLLLRESVPPCAPVLRSKPRVGLFFFGSAAWLLVAACSAKTSGDPNGTSAGAPASAAGSAGSAGSIDSTGGSPSSAGASGTNSVGQCSPGDTRPCVGPGACSGGQACGGDQKWAACDCGGQSGNGGAPATAGGAGGEAGTGVGGAMGTGPGAGDEPCPAEAIDADCSAQCSAKSAACVPHAANSCTYYSILGTDHVADGKVFGRLPSHPGSQCTCTTGPATAYSTAIRFNGTPPVLVHLSVPAPWYLVFSGGYACQSDQHVSCDLINGGTIGVVTNDPNAPAINLKFEAGACP